MAVSQEIKNVITKEKLEHLKNVQVLSRQQIAVMFGVGESTIKRLLSEYGIKSVHNPNRSIKSIDTTKPLVDYNPNTIKKIPELAERLVKETSLLDNVVDISLPHRYHFLKNGMTEIPKCLCGKDVKADKEYTSKVFSSFCSAECSRQNSKKSKSQYDVLQDIEYLKKLRFEDGMSLESMRDLINCNIVAIKQAFKSNGIDLEKLTWMHGTDEKIQERISKRVISRGIREHGEEKFDKLNNAEYLKSLYDEGMTFVEISKILEVNESVVSYAFNKLEIEYDPVRYFSKGTSRGEILLKEFIESIYDGEIVHGYRYKYNEYELDIYLPELGIGFEHNGVFHHSSKMKSSNYHKIKREYFKNKGIRVIQIWSDDWNVYRDRVKKFITNILGKNTESRVGARKCEVVQLTHKEYINFLEENHLLGAESTKVRLGLVYNNTLLSVMGFKTKPCPQKYTKTEGHLKNWELTRFSNTSVSGAFSKLLNYFKSNYNPDVIYSLADLDIVDCDSNVYSKHGFTKLHESYPSYGYYNPRTKVIEHKFNWRKKRFAKLGYDTQDTTEPLLAEAHGLLQCYDSGKIMYKLTC